MICDSCSARRRVPEVLALVVTLSLLGASFASAQECVGFERRDVITGGTNGVESIRVVDMDGDDDLDVLSASFGDGNVYWFENDWDSNDPMRTPSFRAHLVSGGLNNASCVYAADLDGDGDTDVVGSSRDDNAVYWFEQSQGVTPIFSPRTVSQVVSRPLSVFAIDMDGDTDIDVLSASFLDNTIAWHENVGGSPPTFTKHLISISALGAASVFAIDMDGDGDIDVLSASRLAVPLVGAESPEESWGIAWYEQTDELHEVTQKPIFIPHKVWATSMGATSVHAADVDGDGDVDVLSATHGDDTIAWHENVSDPDAEDPPTFTEHIISAQAMGARSVVTGFVNDDGFLDVLSASQWDDKIAWYRSDGGTPPTFTENVLTTDATHADDVRVGDLDNDGDLDIVTASSVPGFPASQDEIRWYENVGPGGAPQFVGRDIYFSADGAISAVAADLDDDGDEDVATAGRTNQIAWYRSDGADLPSFEERVINLNALGPSDIAAADLDGDGLIDLVSASRDDDKVAWYENDGADPPEFIEAPIATNVDNAWDVYVVDLDGDTYLDILAAANVAPVPVDPPTDPPTDPDPVDNIFLFLNEGVDPPEFTEIVITQNAPGARSVHAGDIDNDGTLDVVWASYDGFRIGWNPQIPGPNPGDPPSFGTEELVTTTAFGASSVFVADMDGDMEVDDILTAESISFTVAWYERIVGTDPDSGDEIITYTRHSVANSVDDTSSAIAEDMDGDGDMDVIATAPGEEVIGWFENLGGTPPQWDIHVVSQDADYSQKVTVGDINNDDQPDIISGSRLSVFWYEGSGETCDMFDADGDGLIDGVELAWIGRSFGQVSAGPVSEWWAGVDFNQDGMIDGDDLAILSSPGVFGFTTETCVYICR